MSSSYGENLRVHIFGESHGPAVGVTVEGIPAGEAVDLAELQRFLDRRAPGRNAWSTPRKEADVPEFLSGLREGKTCGTPLTAILKSANTRSGDYDALRDVPRPGHADYTAWVKYGESRDSRGGGHFSGRLTAPLCVAGGICLQLLAREGITIISRVAAIGGVRDEGDSLGGVIECAVLGLPAGLGDPMFDGMENRIAAAVFGVPAVKGIEFGAGFTAAGLRGSENNDAFSVENGRIITESNHCGGILGGITDGMPLTFRAAVKPTPSIARPQQSVDLNTGEIVPLTVTGRHDPCIVPRAVPCLEAAAAIAVYDALLARRKEQAWN